MPQLRAKIQDASQQLHAKLQRHSNRGDQAVTDEEHIEERFVEALEELASALEDIVGTEKDSQ